MLKAGFVGDDGIGKTSMLLQYKCGAFPGDDPPSTVENFLSEVEIDGQPAVVSLWDTVSGADYDRIRLATYQGMHVFVICFSVSCRDSFHRVAAKWLPEVQSHSPGVPFILCATKADLRDDSDTVDQLEAVGKGVVTAEEGRKLADDAAAAAYLECSALTGDGIENVFCNAFKLAAAEAAAAREKRACALL